MITQINKNFNENNLENLITKYNEYCLNANFTFFKCPSCHCTGSIVRHGYYCRTIYINGIKYRICILRIKCKKCGKTHAVLPSFVIPYLLTSINDAVMVIKDELDISKCYSTKVLLKKSYSLWVNRVLSFCENIFVVLNDLHNLVIECSKRFKMCFLQNHQGKFFCL